MDKVPTFRGAPSGDRFRPIERKPLTDQGRIDRHRFYGRRAWSDCRASKLRRDPLCERCRKTGAIVEAKHVHHRIDLADAPDLAYRIDNLESLCHSCHSRETAKRMGGSCQGDGSPTRPR